MYRKGFRFTAILLVVAMLFSVPGLTGYAQSGLDGWSVQAPGDPDYDVFVDNTQSYKGNGSMAIINRTAATSNVYVLISQVLNVEEGKKYYVGAKVKSEYAEKLDMMISWEKRYDTTIYGPTFDWTNFQFLYTAKSSGPVEFQIVAEGACKVWVDEIQFTDIETGENLLVNTGFDDGVDNEKVFDIEDLSDSSHDEIYNEIMTSDSFSEESINKVIGGFKYIPVAEAKNIKIDSNTEEWTGYEVVSMPTLSSQYQIYISDERQLDVQAECRFAYDNEYLYMLVEVLDDVTKFVDGDEFYWQGDSLQFTLSSFDESYGKEYGASLNSVTGALDLHNIASDGVKILSAGKSYEDNGKIKTVYEIGIPWGIPFEEKPDKFLFNILANDNDGDGRRYCAELAPGISEGKTNVHFPVLELVTNKKDWYSWGQIRGGTNTYENTENIYDCFIVNRGDSEKSFTITSNVSDDIYEVTVPAHTGVRKEFKNTFTEMGDYDVSFTFAQDDVVSENTVKVSVMEVLATEEQTKEAIELLTKQAKELKELIEKCNNKGISTDYEEMHQYILERFAGFLQDDLDCGDLSRVSYTKRVTTKIYNDDMKNLQEYLDGTKTPLEVPEYITSTVTTDENTHYAEVIDENGEFKKQPVVFSGYGHNLSKEVIADLKKYGGNATQFEIGPDQSMSVLPGWRIAKANEIEAEFGVANTNPYDGEQSLRVEVTSPQKSNCYYMVNQYINTIPGHTYTLSGYTRSDDNGHFKYFSSAWVSGGSVSAGKDWTEFKSTTMATSDSTEVMLIFEVPTNGVYLDGLTFVDMENPDENLLLNGDFEIGDGKFPVFYEGGSYMQQILEKLEICEENNISVSFLLSPHYFHDSLIDEYGIRREGFGFHKYDVNSPIARQIMEEHFKNVLTLVKDYTCIANITLSNEPYFRVDECDGLYDEKWHKFLEGVYGNIDELNRIYGSSYNAFSDVPLVQNEKNPAMNYDYWTFNSIQFATWHNYLADLSHKYAPGIPVQSKIMGHMYRSTGLHGLKSGVNYELFTDFFDINGCDYGGNMSLSDIQNYPLGKEMQYDYMQSIIEKPVVDSENHYVMDGENLYIDAHAKHMAQDVYNGAVHGRDYSVSWILRRENNNPEILGNILYRPDALVQCGDATWDLMRNADSIASLRKEPHEIGILYTNESVINETGAMHAAYQSYIASCFSGKIPRFIVETQLEKMDNYSILIVPMMTYVENKTLVKIKDYIEKGGKVIILNKNSLSKTERNADSDSSLLEFIRANSKVLSYNGAASFVPQGEIEAFRKTLRQTMQEVGINYAELIDLNTGKPDEKTEYTLGIHEGKLIINVSNFNFDVKDIKSYKLFVNGKPVDNLYNLRTAEDEGETIELGGLEVGTYSVEVKNPFFDTYNHWGDEEVEKLYGRGLVNGVSVSRFAPDNSITRAEFLALVVRSLGWESVGYKNNISDVDSKAWYAPTVASALKFGLIDENEFRPDEKATREEMSKMLYAACSSSGVELNDNAEIKFLDYDSITDKKSVAAITQIGLIDGYEDNTFRASGYLTRAEATTVINRLYEILTNKE